MIDLGKKIMIIGSGGSGKSTLALQLGEILKLPVINLDMEFWNPGWIATPKEEWHEKQRHLMSGSEWIADGNFSGSLEIRLEQTDSIIFLDFNRVTCIYGVIKRWLTNYGKTRPTMAKECPEKIDFEFLKWIWQFPSTSRPNIMKKISNHKNLKLFVIKNRKELKQFIEEVSPTV